MLPGAEVLGHCLNGTNAMEICSASKEEVWLLEALPAVGSAGAQAIFASARDSGPGLQTESLVPIAGQGHLSWELKVGS